MFLSSTTLEYAISFLTSAIIAAAVVKGSSYNDATVRHGSALVLSLLTICSVAVEVLAVDKDKGNKNRFIDDVYRQRKTQSSGIVLGTLTIPWVCASLILLEGKGQLQTQDFFEASVSSSLLMLIYLGLFCSKNIGLLNKRRFERCMTASVSIVMLLNLIFLREWPKFTTFTSISFVSLLIFHNIERMLPQTFTLGEAIVTSQGSVLLMYFTFTNFSQLSSPNRLMLTTLVISIAASVVIGLGRSIYSALQTTNNNNKTPKPKSSQPILLQALSVCAIAIAIAVLLSTNSSIWLIEYIFYDQKRLYIVLYWALTMSAFLPLMLLLAKAHSVPNIVLRKGYHILAIMLFLPALYMDEGLLRVALSLAFALLAVVEVLRMAGLPHLSRHIHSFMSAFTDSRDSGVLFVTHFTLLLGLSIPVWLSNTKQYALAGIISTGVGDAAASIVGSNVGKIPIALNSKKTVEGTSAGIVANLGMWYLLQSMGLMDVQWPAVMVATLLNGVLEAATEQLDNLFIPLHYFALLGCLRF